MFLWTKGYLLQPGRGASGDRVTVLVVNACKCASNVAVSRSNHTLSASPLKSRLTEQLGSATMAGVHFPFQFGE